MTRLLRSDAPARSLSVAIVLWALVAVAVFFAALFVVVGIAIPSAFTGNEQTAMAAWLGMIFVVMAVVLDLYRKHYVPDELIHKKRRPKLVPRREIR